MNNDSLTINLDKIIDIGNPAQVQLYTDILADQNTQTKIEKIIKLISLIQTNLIENPNETANQKSENSPIRSDQISRLLGHLQHFVSILQSFSFDSEFLNLFISNKEPSSKLIPSQFFEAESKRLQEFLETFPDKSFINSLLSQMKPEFLTQKLKELRLIQNKVENTTNVLDLRNHFQEICTLFEFSSILNDRLINRLSNPMNQTNASSLEKKIEFLSKKLKEKEVINEKYEFEINKLKQLCQDYSIKSDELILRNKKYKQEKIQLINQIKEFKKQIDNDDSNTTIHNLENEKQEILEAKNKEIEDLVNKINKISSDFETLKEQYTKLQNDDSKSEISIENSDVSEKMKQKYSNMKCKFKKLKQVFKETQSQLENEKYLSAQIQSKNEMLINTMKSEFEQKLSAEIEKSRQFEEENQKVNSQNETLLTNLTQFKDKFEILKNQATNEIDSLNHKISILQKQKKELVNIVERLNENAPTDSEINETITSLQIEKNELRVQNEKLAQKVADLQNRNENLAKASNDIADTFESRIDTLNQLKKEIKNLTKIRDQLQSEISMNTENHSKNDAINQFDSNSFPDSHQTESNQFELTKENDSSTNLEKAELSSLNKNETGKIDQNSMPEFISSGSPIHEARKQTENEMNISKFAMMLANALSEPLEMSQIKNELFRLVDIVRSEHSKMISSQLSNSLVDNLDNLKSNVSESMTSSIPILIPQFDDLDREIMNLQRSIKFK